MFNFSGSRCRENVIGRVCDHCVPGHYAFPDCVPCSCDVSGTTDDVCDQNTAQCYCKKHVRGQVGLLSAYLLYSKAWGLIALIFLIT